MKAGSNIYRLRPYVCFITSCKLSFITVNECVYISWLNKTDNPSWTYYFIYINKAKERFCSIFATRICNIGEWDKFWAIISWESTFEDASKPWDCLFVYMSSRILEEVKSINVTNEVKCIHSHSVGMNKYYLLFQEYQKQYMFCLVK